MLSNKDKDKEKKKKQKEKEKKKAKKKSHGLLKFLLILLAIIVIPITTIYVLFADDSFKVKNNNEKIDAETLINNKIASCLNKTAQTNKVSLAITQDDLNMILNGVKDGLPDGTDTYVKGFSCSINEDKYIFEIGLSVSAYIIKSKAIIETKIEETDEAFIFRIENIKVGKVSGINSFASSIAKNFINDSTLNQAFASSGLSFTASLSNQTITYTKADALHDINSALESSGELATSIVHEFINDSLLSFSFYDNSEIKAEIDLSSLKNNANYVTPEKNSGLVLSDYKTDLVTLLDNGIVDLDSNHPTYAYTYLIKGYDNCDEDIQDYVKDKDFSSVGINNVSSYQGYSVEESANIGEIIQQSLSSLNLTTLSANAKINENLITSICENSGLLGYSYVFTQQTETSHQVSCVTLNNFYVNFVEDRMYLTVGVDINGCQTVICFDTQQQESSGYSISLSVEEIYFGTNTTTNVLKQVIYGLVSQALEEDEYLSFDQETATFTYDFAPGFNNIPSAISSLLKTDITIEGDSLSDLGYINLGLSIA
ncbi:MAG: hypothetical protein WCR67_03095 [Bacilli bacterium]